jgi:hypothetical protein
MLGTVGVLKEYYTSGQFRKDSGAGSSGEAAEAPQRQGPWAYAARLFPRRERFPVSGVVRATKFPEAISVFNPLLMTTGNNIRLGGDLWRRILTCRIDPATDAPEEREFALEPGTYCKEHRPEIVSAALALICGYIEAGRERLAKDGIGSFEDWDALVRGCG